jgi:mRNA-degrading endonuclease RelE of RelBE toxin-antitoxin system
MITFDEEMDKLPSERRAKIEAKTQELLQEMQIIDELLQRLGLSSE